MSAKELATQPTPAHLTLLFKYDKSTTLISVLPSQTLAEVKSILLAVLRSRNISTFPGTSVLLPIKPDDLELGVTKDRRDGRDASKGWIVAEDARSLNDGSKSSKKKSTSAKSDEPIKIIGDLDLKDGSYVAYRLKTSIDDLVDEGVDEDMDLRGQDEMEWNVTVPSYDDEEDVGPTVEGNTYEDEDDEMDIAIPTPRNNIAR